MLASFQNGDFWYGSWQPIKTIATQYCISKIIINAKTVVTTTDIIDMDKLGIKINQNIKF